MDTASADVDLVANVEALKQGLEQARKAIVQFEQQTGAKVIHALASVRVLPSYRCDLSFGDGNHATLYSDNEAKLAKIKEAWDSSAK